MMKDELIGKKIKILSSNNRSLVDIQGIVVDETKNILFIEADGKVKKIVKDQCVFEINNQKVAGKDLTKKPEERIKK